MKYIKLYEQLQTKKTVYVCGKPIKVSIAISEEDQKKGYMFSNGPDEDEGMLFVYPKKQSLIFWMKNVRVPLDIIFFDENGKFINHKNMKPHNGEDLYYKSDLPAKYALELKSGWINQYFDQSNSDLIILNKKTSI